MGLFASVRGNILGETYIGKDKTANTLRGALLAGTIISGMIFISPAMAQEKTAVKSDENVVIVTGSIIRNKNLKANAPITEISAVQMEKRGGTTIEAIAQTLPGNGIASNTNEWSAGGNFCTRCICYFTSFYDIKLNINNC